MGIVRNPDPTMMVTLWSSTTPTQSLSPISITNRRWFDAIVKEILSRNCYNNRNKRKLVCYFRINSTNFLTLPTKLLCFYFGVTCYLEQYEWSTRLRTLLHVVESRNKERGKVFFFYFSHALYPLIILPSIL